MPELPEVETVCRTLRPLLTGQKIVDVTILHAKMINVPVTVLKKRITGEQFKDISRIGKYIVFHLSNDVVLVSHLRMEGKYIELKDPTSPLPRYARAVITLQDQRRIVYADMRKFGTWELATEQSYRHLPSLVQLGIEPMQVIDIDAIHQALTASSRPIKSLLLDQTILLGIGNIYADEILFATQLHPLTPGKKLTLIQTQDMIHHSQTILLQAIASGGSRIRSYQPGQGIDGHFQHKIHVYGREGLPCHTCNHRIHRITIAGRSASYCPRCQHRFDFPFVIAITGEIATGKSTMMQFADQQGYVTLRADDYVKKIYQQKKYFPHLKRIFGQNIIRDGRVQTAQILEVIIADQSKRIALEKFIHPIVETMLIQAMLATRVKIVFIEIPLLFQTNLDYLADKIILMEQPFALQTKRVGERNPQLAEKLLTLNQHNRSREYRAFADVIITNEKSLQTLEKMFAKTLKTFGL